MQHLTSLLALPLFCGVVVSGHPLRIEERTALVKRAGFPGGAIDNTTAQCMGTIDGNTWNSSFFGNFLTDSANTLQPFTTGIYQTYVNAVPALQSEDNQCTLEIATCDIDFSANCPANPIVVNVLSAMTNFANFFRLLQQELTDKAQSVINNADTIVTTFQPLPSFKSPVTPIKGAGLGLSILSTLAGAIPGIGNIIKAGNAAISVAGTSLAFAGGNQPTLTGAPDPSFSNAADVTTSINNIKDGITTGLTNFVDSLLNDVPEATGYDTDAKQLPQILFGGAFAAPVSSLPTSIKDNFGAGLNSLAINELWSQSQVAVFTFDSSDIASSTGTPAPDVCDGDNVFPAGVKFCDASGRASILQAIPTSDGFSGLSFDQQIDPTTYSVPGFANLGDFQLKFSDIITAAANNQRITNGYQTPGPAPEDFANNIETINPTDVTLGQTIFSNLPVCDLKQNPAAETDTLTNCDAIGGNSAVLCRFYHRALVGCPGQTVAGKNWPYQTQNLVNSALNIS